MSGAQSTSGGNHARSFPAGGVIAAVVIAALVIAGGAWWLVNREDRTTVNALFARTVGIYPGSDVRVLGVKVGKVDAVHTEGDSVRVQMTVNSGVKLPKNLDAVQVIPSVVADRYVQLTPAYSGGPMAGHHITLGRDRTMEPVEVDDLYASVKKLSTALGPQGANKDGAVSDFVSTSAANISGNGDKLGRAIENLSHAAQALDSSRGNYVETVKNIDVFVKALEDNDSQVRVFNTQMASFNSFFANENAELTASLSTLSHALGDVAGFIRDNRDHLDKTVRGIEPTIKALTDNKSSLLEALTLIPLGFANFTNTYNAEAGAVTARLNIRETQDPLNFLCKYAFYINQAIQLPGNPAYDQYRRIVAPIINQCQAVAGQIRDNVLTPLIPALPFGLLSGTRIQSTPAPNPYKTVPPATQPQTAAGSGGK